MADLLDADGLQTSTLDELIAALTLTYKDIYGEDINIESNSPDGQALNILAQEGVDLRELITQVYNSFNPDNALGTVLDERVAINNIQRLGGTYTTQPVTLTLDRTLTLDGLDADFNDPEGTGYTVQDDAGNEFILIDTATLAAGIHIVNFRAKNIGQVETVINTITTAVTVVLGVTTINNPSAALEIGEDQETDADLKIRRVKSLALGSTGYLDGLLGAVLNLDGVTGASLYENNEDLPDANFIPGHAIWLIVEGGANTEIGEVLKNKKSAGCNMRGNVVVNVPKLYGPDFVAKFDRPSAKDLHIQFDIQKTETGATFDQAAIKAYMVDNLIYNISDFAETSEPTTVAAAGITSLGGGGVPVNMEISDDGAAWVDYLEVDTLDEQWTLATARITITVLP